MALGAIISSMGSAGYSKPPHTSNAEWCFVLLPLPTPKITARYQCKGGINKRQTICEVWGFKAVTRRLRTRVARLWEFVEILNIHFMGDRREALLPLQKGD